MVTRRRPARKKRTGTRPVGYLGGSHLGGSPARRSGAWVALVLGALVLVNLYVFVWDKKTSVRAIKEQAAHPPPPAAMLPSVPLAPVEVVPVAPRGAIDGKVGKSDTLGRLLKHSGLTASEADEVIRALSGVLDFKAIRQGQTYRIERGADGRVSKFELVVSKAQTVRAVRDTAGALVGG